ncbi:acyl-CoA synthetase (AMP-forming)/AMP-acid ligase II [Catenulispora sp. MAP12-49]|uniref:AMP-binding protein n=1 Tax=Catenulispora sp. MAP12-49 TaxID=3156302 RepID=UPI003518ED62
MTIRPAGRVHGQRPEHWAVLYPDQPAVTAEGGTLTFREWNERADRLADALARRRLGANDGGANAAGASDAGTTAAGTTVAAVALAPGPDWFVVSLALAKLGWTLATLPPDAPASQLSRMVGDTGAVVLFLEESADSVDAAADQDTVGPGVLLVCGRSGLAALLDEGTRTPRGSRADAPLMVYTSGTTGERQGVRRAIPDPGADAERTRRLKEYQRDIVAAHHARLRNRTLLSMPMHHGSGPGFAHRALSLAGTVHVAPVFDAVAVLAAIERERITQWAAAPWMLHRLRALPREVLLAYDVSSIEAVNVGSAAVSYGLKRWISSYFGEGRLYEFYGSTEAGVIAAMPPAEQHRKPGSSGRLLRHVEVRVVGADGRTLPEGAEGELLVRTPQTAHSAYLGADARELPITADGFLRVGDMGRLDDEGYVFLSGRVSDLIQRPSGPLSAAVLERALGEHPAIVDAAAVGLPGRADFPDVVVFCELVPGAKAPDGAELGRLLAAVPAELLPTEIRVLPQLPRNDVGKVLKKELRSAGAGQGELMEPVVLSAAGPGQGQAAYGSPGDRGPRWYDRDLLDRAWRTVREDALNDAVPEPERYRELALDWDRVREDLAAQLAAGRYRPGPARVVELPKSALTHRPVPLLDPVDRVVLTALAEAVRPAIQDRLGPEVCGATGVSGRGWLDFEKAARALAREARWGITTDVAAFGQNVDLGVLAADLAGCGVAEDIIRALMNQLAAVAPWGLPHDQSAAALLGTFYLSTGDAVLRDLGVGFVRMQDDIRMFGDSPEDLARAFAALERELWSRRLVLPGGKTKLAGARQIVADFLPRGLSPRETFDAALAAGEPAVRDLRFALARLGAAEDPYAVDWLLAELPGHAALAPAAGEYLGILIPDRPELAVRVVDLLREGHRRAHPFVVSHVLIALNAAAAPDAGVAGICRALLADSGENFHVRQQAARCIARHGSAADWDLLTGYLDTPDPELRRTLHFLIATVKAR